MGRGDHDKYILEQMRKLFTYIAHEVLSHNSVITWSDSTKSACTPYLRMYGPDSQPIASAVYTIGPTGCPRFYYEIYTSEKSIFHECMFMDEFAKRFVNDCRDWLFPSLKKSRTHSVRRTADDSRVITGSCIWRQDVKFKDISEKSIDYVDPINVPKNDEEQQARAYAAGLRALYEMDDEESVWF